MAKQYLEGTAAEIEAINVTLYSLPRRGIPCDALAASYIDDITGVGWTLQQEEVWYADTDNECCLVEEDDVPEGIKVKLKKDKKAKYDKVKEPKKDEVKEIKPDKIKEPKK